MQAMSSEDWAAVVLTLKLASTVTLILLLISAPLAWWLVQTRSWFKGPVAALVAMPVILPPTVLGFYFLVLLSPEGWLGLLLSNLNLPSLLFSFSGLVFASVIYSLPFVVQPIYLAMNNIPRDTLDAAATLGAGPFDCFFSIVLPLSRTGIIAAAVLGFIHTVGEFGVVLMIGGNIPEHTKVLSIQIYDHVEALNYAAAHTLSAGLVVFSFLALLVLYSLHWRSMQGASSLFFARKTHNKIRLNDR